MEFNTRTFCKHTLTQMVFLLFAFATCSAWADELFLKDGSKLVGVVKNMENGILEFETKSVGKVRIKWSEVKEIYAENPLTLMLVDEKIVNADAIINDDSGITIKTMNEKSEETISSAELAYINPKSWQRGESIRWTGRVNLDLESKNGNSETDEYYGDIQTEIRRKKDRLIIEADYEKDKSDGEVTEENWKLVNLYDYFVSKKLSYGAFLSFEHDRFQDLDLRYSLGPQVGYQFIKSTNMNLSGNLNFLYVNENFDDEEDSDYAAFGWRINFDRFIIPERIQFYHRHNVLQDVSESDNFEFNSWTGFRFPLFKGIVASTEAEFEYDKNVPENVDKTETTYRIKLGYHW